MKLRKLLFNWYDLKKERELDKLIEFRLSEEYLEKTKNHKICKSCGSVMDSVCMCKIKKETK